MSVAAQTFLVTGGTGFLGSALVRRLVRDGHRVRALDNNSRGMACRLADVVGMFEMIEADVRDAEAVMRAASGVDGIIHLAFINGTSSFYERPDLVLDVGIRGMLSILAALNGDITLYLASSSEVYQSPSIIPTDESAPLWIPDPLNPRYSYGGAKATCELMALHWAARLAQRVVIFRPHNVYGPDMGFEHVIPQFSLRMAELNDSIPGGAIPFPIEGSGEETRAFVHIDDLTEGVMRIIERGENRNIYHVGTELEITIESLARQIAENFDREIVLVPGPLKPGGTMRRCPDISKLRALGYSPKVALKDGLSQTVRWYRDYAARIGHTRRAA